MKAIEATSFSRFDTWSREPGKTQAVNRSWGLDTRLRRLERDAPDPVKAALDSPSDEDLGAAIAALRVADWRRHGRVLILHQLHRALDRHG